MDHENDLNNFLINNGLKKNQHILVHSAFRKIRGAFPTISIHQLIHAIQGIITQNGSLIMPAFTYCFKKSIGDYEIFDRQRTPSKVGAVSEVFRKMPDVIRTSSPTHSFSLWGKITDKIIQDNTPTSPLGKGSVVEWLAEEPNTHLLMLGVDFTAMSFCHYIEILAPVPWHDFSPWDYLHVQKIGVSTAGEQSLEEIPGCSKSFINFERDLIGKHLIQSITMNKLHSYFLPVQLILTEGLRYFKDHPENLLCPAGLCQACDSRWEFYIHQNQNTRIE